LSIPSCQAGHQPLKNEDLVQAPPQPKIYNDFCSISFLINAQDYGMFFIKLILLAQPTNQREDIRLHLVSLTQASSAKIF